ncbi:T6SS effector BTH_I2691 family protein [Pseudomonas huaxiensis]|uniref:T6SS effector BTH_I2691 family protein n=1 Tax=Pseudomonas huaxiensis TaxID=2213017 RepID=UPI00298A0807|nr:T6SS effector BTH_I2691 family protein [Pseudomonas huaxiensis]
MAMTEADLQMHQVLEYAQPMAGDFHSVHGFYPRNSRLRALAGHVRTMTEEHELPNGVLALVLPDPVGVVQELNAQRLIRYQHMQEWRAEPQRRFEQLTSQALLGIRKVYLDRAEKQAIKDAETAVETHRDYNARPMSYRAPLPSLDLEKETKRRIAKEQANVRDRLGDRYDEKARGDFQTKVEKTLAGWQQIIDDVGEHYATHFQSPAFQLATRYDYSVHHVESVAAFICMVGQCLAGGPTGLIDNDKLDATQRLWKQQLDDRNSLLYQALVAKDKGWLEQLRQDLSDAERTRLYHGIKTLITTDQGTALMRSSVQAAVGQLLGGAATASNALGKHISEHTNALVGHMHREAWLRFSGVRVTQVTVALKAGEYLTLLNEVLYEGTERFIAQLDQQFRKPAARKVRAMLLSGPPIPALASSYGKLIDVTLWTMESAEDLRVRLEKLRDGIGDGIGDALRPVSIDVGALKGGMDDFARHLSLNGEVARLFAQDTMRSMRNAARMGGTGVFNLGLALGSLWFQQDSLRKSYGSLLKAFGDERPEAFAAFMAASVGNMGAGVEIVGAAVWAVRPDWTLPVHSAGTVSTVKVGARILQFGSAIVSMASAVEGMQYALAAGRTHGVGDKAARNFYAIASLMATGSALAGVWGSIGAANVLLVPLAIAVLLGFVAYGFAVWAKGKESQPLELWAQHSLWGLPKEHRRWKDAHDMDTAIGALNAALLGLTADLDVKARIQRRGDEVSGRGGTMEYNVVLPGYDPGASSYEWTLWAYRPGETPGGMIAGGRTGGTNDPLPAPAFWKQPGYEPDTTAPVVTYDAESKTLEIMGSIVFWGVLDFHALELEVSYWPDKSDESGMARLIVREDKIAGWQWGFM